MEHEPSPLPTGWQYSEILIRRTRNTLIEKYGEPITDEIVARHLEVETERIRAVMDGMSTFGTEFFRQQAKSLDQTLAKFTADLALWNRDDTGMKKEET